MSEHLSNGALEEDEDYYLDLFRSNQLKYHILEQKQKKLRHKEVADLRASFDAFIINKEFSKLEEIASNLGSSDQNHILKMP